MHCKAYLFTQLSWQRPLTGEIFKTLWWNTNEIPIMAITDEILMKLPITVELPMRYRYSCQPQVKYRWDTDAAANHCCGTDEIPIQLPTTDKAPMRYRYNCQPPFRYRWDTDTAANHPWDTDEIPMTNRWDTSARSATEKRLHITSASFTAEPKCFRLPPRASPGPLPFISWRRDLPAPKKKAWTAAARDQLYATIGRHLKINTIRTPSEKVVRDKNKFMMNNCDAIVKKELYCNLYDFLLT